jgi:hypothetical protein
MRQLAPDALTVREPSLASVTLRLTGLIQAWSGSDVTPAISTPRRQFDSADTPSKRTNRGLKAAAATADPGAEKILNADRDRDGSGREAASSDSCPCGSANAGAKVYTFNRRAQLPPVSSNLSSRLLHCSLRREPLPIVSLPLGRVFRTVRGVLKFTDTRQRLRILCWVGVADRLPKAAQIEWPSDIIESSRSRPPGTESRRQRRSTSVSGMRRPDAFSGAIYDHPRGCHGDTARLGV